MRRPITATLGAAALVGAVLAASTATAAPPSGLDSYAAGSTATALELNIAGEAGLNLAVSRTGAVITDTPQAAANGAALLLAGTPVPGDAPSAAPEGPATNEECALDLDLDELTGGALSLVVVDLACVETAAAIEAGAPGASATTGELQITLLAPGGALLEPVLEPLLGGVSDVVEAVNDGVCGSPLADLLCEGGVLDDLTGITPLDLLADLVDDLQDTTFVLAQVTVAPTASLAGADNTTGVSALAGANGATITLLPGIGQTLAELGLAVPAVTEPLATINVGQSLASVVRHPTTGAADTDASAAQLLSVNVSEADLGILSELTDTLNDLVAGLAGNPLNCDLDNPLADLVCIDLGEVRELSREQLASLDLDFGDGTVGVQSSAATVRVLRAATEFIGGDLVTLSLATATASANAVPAALPTEPGQPVTPASPEIPRDLPRTGGSAVPIGVLAGLIGLAVLGTTLVRRSALS